MPESTLRPVRYLLGAVLLITAIAASGMLSYGKLRGIAVPGCGPDSDCARAAASAWGSIPGLGWATSHVGVAWFLGLLGAWIVTGGVLTGFWRWAARLGGVGSLVLVGVMVAGGYLCKYCVTAHVANLLFLVVLETRSTADAAPWRGRPGLAFVALAFVSTAGLVVGERTLMAQVEEQAAQSTQEIVEAGNAGIDAERGFTGRWRTGPERAAIRIVVFSDYQCPDCKNIEADLRRIVAEREDTSLSAKHFPFCKDCNPVAARNDANPHPNACWAARAAEAAGRVGGNEAFWGMHHWLFDRSGMFQRPDLLQILPRIGIDDAQAFFQVMEGPDVLEPIHADIEEAVNLGLYTTPMIFINGVELTGWKAPGAVRRAVEAVAATQPEPMDASADAPPDVYEKAVTDWRNEPVLSLAPDEMAWPYRADDVAADAIEVVAWGDLQEPFTGELDARLRAFCDDHPRVRYVFRPYPLDQNCNEHASRTMFPLGCLAARAALAAGYLGGSDAYWAMQPWLVEHKDDVNVTALREHAASIGLDADAFMDALSSAEVARELKSDIDAGKRVYRRGVPFLFIDGKRVVRWKHQDKPVLEHVLDAVLE